MIWIDLKNAEETLKKLQRVPTAMDRLVVLEEVAEDLHEAVQDETPDGWSGKLRDSVLMHSTSDEAVVGYDDEVETAGNPALDSVLRPRTRGRSVRVWVKPDDLQTVLEAVVAEYLDEDLDGVKQRFLEELDRVVA